jgi:hypothetical protein
MAADVQSECRHIRQGVVSTLRNVEGFVGRMTSEVSNTEMAHTDNNLNVELLLQSVSLTNTIPIPGGLFQYEPPAAAVGASPPGLIPPSLEARRQGVQTRGRGRITISESKHIGNRIPCRFLNKCGGCARGVQCAFLHMATTRPQRTALEEELAKKKVGE